MVLLAVQFQPRVTQRGETSLKKYTMLLFISASIISVKIGKAVPEISWNNQTDEEFKSCYFHVSAVYLPYALSEKLLSWDYRHLNFIHLFALFTDYKLLNPFIIIIIFR